MTHFLWIPVVYSSDSHLPSLTEGHGRKTSGEWLHLSSDKRAQMLFGNGTFTQAVYVLNYLLHGVRLLPL